MSENYLPITYAFSHIGGYTQQEEQWKKFIVFKPENFCFTPWGFYKLFQFVWNLNCSYISKLLPAMSVHLLVTFCMGKLTGTY